MGAFRRAHSGRGGEGCPVGSSLPMWVILAGPIVALLASAASTVVAVLAIRSNNRSQERQQQLQEWMQQAELEERRRTDLRTERRAAYRTMGRITTTVNVSKPYELSDLAEAHFEIEILTNSAEVQEAPLSAPSISKAGNIVGSWGRENPGWSFAPR